MIARIGDPDPSDHDEAIPVITMAGIRSLRAGTLGKQPEEPGNNGPAVPRVVPFLSDYDNNW